MYIKDDLEYWGTVGWTQFQKILNNSRICCSKITKTDWHTNWTVISPVTYPDRSGSKSRKNCSGRIRFVNDVVRISSSRRRTDAVAMAMAVSVETYLECDNKYSS